jgi:hypothetical protein
MGIEQRQQVQAQFSGSAQILISTDAGGEGINLQFCHIVVNYDVPWNPMRVEQRIGRVDRIGQAHPVRALNFLLQGTIENRVQEVLEEKLKIIFDEFGIDKTSDVLDSSQAEALFDKLYIQAIIKPDKLEETVETAVRLVEDQAHTGLDGTHLLGSQGELDPAIAQQTLENPMPYWLEKMTIQYLHTQGYNPVRKDGAWVVKSDQSRGKTNRNMQRRPLRSPQDILLQTIEGKSIVFIPQDKWNSSEFTHLSLDSAFLRSIIQQIPTFSPEEPVPTVLLAGIPQTLRGLWSLWRVLVRSADWSAQRLLPLFLNEEGRPFLPTGRSLWELLLDQDIQVEGYLDRSMSTSAFEQCKAAAENLGKGLFIELTQIHQQGLELDRQKGEYAFQVRRKMIERVGLFAVRAHRLAILAQEQQSWIAEIDQRAFIQPELTALLILNVQPAQA